MNYRANIERKKLPPLVTLADVLEDFRVFTKMKYAKVSELSRRAKSLN